MTTNSFELLKTVAVALGSLWIVHNALVKSAEFVNRMREVVISGFDGATQISPEHREAVRFDWLLSMCASVFVCFLFGGILLASAVIYWNLLGSFAAIALVAIGVYPAVCGVFFILCGDQRQLIFPLDDN